jgi:hypothetical protein
VKGPRTGLRADKTMIENNLNNEAVSQIPPWFERKFEFTFPIGGEQAGTKLWPPTAQTFVLDTAATL